MKKTTTKTFTIKELVRTTDLRHVTAGGYDPVKKKEIVGTSGGTSAP